MTDKSLTNSQFAQSQRAHFGMGPQRQTDVPAPAPSKRRTLDLEEGEAAEPLSSNEGTSKSVDESTPSNSSGPHALGAITSSTNTSGGTDSQEKPRSRRTVEKDGSSAGLGLAGQAPPRRMTMRSDDGHARSFHDLFVPEHRLKPAPNTVQSLKNIFFASPFNILLICIPVSWALHFALESGNGMPGPSCDDNFGNNLAVFITAFFGIVPLAQLLSYGTEEIALRVGQTLGGLINASLGNAVELIVAIIALFHCELTIVQTSLIGSVLSNLLLVLGTCFFVGGLRRQEQEFKQTAAQLNSGLLAMAVIAVLIPAGFHATLGESIDDRIERPDLLKVSRGVSIILLIIYGGFLYFTLSSHKSFYEDDEEPEEEPTLNLYSAIGLLLVSTGLVGYTSEVLVDSIDGVTCQGGLSKTWVGIILLPIVSNAAEHWSAVTGAHKNKMDLAMGIAVGSSIQISIFVIPLLVVIGWIGDKPLSLLFDPFIAILLFLAILIVNYAISDGRSNYMEGWLLMMVYVIIALVTWFVEETPESQLFPDEMCH
ncbi:unnamed protein product [Sympodiomycopsis kandeliae]